MSDGRIPQDVLDGLQSEIESQKAGEMMSAEPEEAQEDEPEAEQAEVQEGAEDTGDLPEGYKTLEEYVADGGDPEYYRGPKAYEKDRVLIGEIKEIKRKLSERDDEMVALQELHEKERQRLLKDIEKKKAEAKESFDFEAYEDLSEQERELNSRNKPQDQGGEPPVIQSYRQQNPKLNPAAPDFDPVHASAFAAAFNALVTDAEKRAGRRLNEQEIGTYLDATAKRLGGLLPAQRRTPKVEGTRRAKPQKDPVGDLPPEYKRMYDRWMAKGNKDQAANLLKQFQANAGA